MAASFVAQNGADENNQAVHHFQWMGTSDPDWVTMLTVWQPWIQQTTFNGRTVLYYLDILSLAAEFMTGWDNGVAAMPVMLHLPAPAALVEIIYVCSAGIPKATATKATVAVQAAAARARYTSAQKTASRLIATDMVNKADVGGALCPWQRRVTYANLALTEGGPIALGWMASRGEFLRFCRDSNLLEALRYAAERNGTCPMRSGMAPHPAPRPNPLPPDTVDPEISAYAACLSMSEIYFNCTPFLRHAFLTIAQKTAACAAELDSIVNPVDGDTHELRRRVRGVIAETAPTVANLLGTGVANNSEVLEYVRRIAISVLPPAQRETKTLYTPGGLAALEAALATGHAAWSLFPEVVSMSREERITALETRIRQQTQHNNAGAATPAASGANLHQSNPGALPTVRAPASSQILAAAARGEFQDTNTAQLLHELDLLIDSPGITSISLHESTLRGCTQATPGRRSVGLAHALVLNNIDGTLINPKFAIFATISTDEHIGRYLAVCMVACYVQLGHMTESQAARLKGLSLTKLAKCIKMKNWKGNIDLVNDVIVVINSTLAKLDQREPTPRVPAHRVYCDPFTNTLCPALAACLMEALGMQKTGEGSIHDLMVESNATIWGMTGWPASLMADLMAGNKALWEAAWGEIGDRYYPCHAGANAFALLPEKNLISGQDEGPRAEWRQLTSGLSEAVRQAGLIARLAKHGSSEPVGTAGFQSALAVLDSTAKGDKGAHTNPSVTPPGKRQKTEPGVDQAQRDAQARLEEAREQSRANSAATRKKYESAGNGEYKGKGDAQIYVYGPSSWKAGLAKKEWGKDVCLPFVFAESCGAGLGKRACPEKSHKAGCPQHTLPPGSKPPSAFNCKKTEGAATSAAKGRAAGKSPGKGRGGGRGTGRGRGAARK